MKHAREVLKVFLTESDGAVIYEKHKEEIDSAIEYMINNKIDSIFASIDINYQEYVVLAEYMEKFCYDLQDITVIDSPGSVYGRFILSVSKNLDASSVSH